MKIKEIAKRSIIPIGTICLVLEENGTPFKNSLICVIQPTWNGCTDGIDYGSYEVQKIPEASNKSFNNSFGAHFHEHQLLVCTDLEQILYSI